MEYLTDAWNYVQGMAPWALLCLGLSILGYILDRIPKFPDWLAGLILCFMGAWLYPLMPLPVASNVVVVAASGAVEAIQGFILGGIAWIGHKLILKKLADRFLPQWFHLNGDSSGSAAPNPPAADALQAQPKVK